MRYLIALPSLSLGAIGALWLAWRPTPYLALPAPYAWPATLWLALAIVAGGALLQRYLPSYRYALRLLAHAIAPLRLRAYEIVLLALLTGLGEELLFRGALLPRLGNLMQALLFGLLHPAGLRGWGYTLYTAAVGWLLGAATVAFGSVWPAVAVHALVNAFGLWRLGRLASTSPRE